MQSARAISQRETASSMLAAVILIVGEAVSAAGVHGSWECRCDVQMMPSSISPQRFGDKTKEMDSECTLRTNHTASWHCFPIQLEHVTLHSPATHSPSHVSSYISSTRRSTRFCPACCSDVIDPP
jgi:hypothetical protein